ncbi:MAG TPA: DUF5131 family protein [Gaiellaceae bacterium]|nr:DUF5131 family protein [Gaiellaceae bacterium]
MSVALAGGTAIEWADYTFNPWWGCRKVSPGCGRCYAATIANHRQPGKQLWGAGHDFRFFADPHWALPQRWARVAPAKLGRRPRVFCASMADVFEERPELDEHRERLFDHTIEATPELDWLILTKRPEFARDWLAAFYDGDHRRSSLPPNVWLGVSIENSRFTWRADVLRQIPAAVRFISAEPLRGSLYAVACGAMTAKGRCTLSPYHHGRCRPGDVAPSFRQPLELRDIDWLICGGESGGRGSHPMHPEWARALRAACEKRAIPFFFKQWGSYGPTDGDGIKAGPGVYPGDICWSLEPEMRAVAADDYVCYPNESDGEHLRYHGIEAGSGGHLLDGRSYRQFPPKGD